MRRTLLAGLVPIALVAGTFCGGDEMAAKKKALAVGDPAPAFSLPGSDGATHSLSDHLGKRAVVIAWFPKAFTGG